MRGRQNGKATRSEDIDWAITQLKNQPPQRGAGHANKKSTTQREESQPVDASLNIELGPDDGQS